MTSLPANLLRVGPTNPILLRVVTAGGKRFRHALTRWLYLGLLMLVLLLAMISTASGSGAHTLSESAKAAMQVFKLISYVQLAMIALLAPVFTAGAITQERDSRTYNILLATPLTNLQILVGSLFSRLYYVLALLLSGLPVFVITMFFGGVTGSDIAMSFSIAASTAVFTGALAMSIAVFRLGSGKTVFWFYVLNAVYLVGVWYADSFLAETGGFAGKTTWLSGLHPFLALQSVVSSTSYTTPEAAEVAHLPKLLQWYRLYPAMAYVTLTSTAAFGMILPSAIFLRRIAQRSDITLGQFLRQVILRGYGGTRRARHVWNNPVAWREAATRATISARGITRWATVVLAILGGLTLIWAHHQGLFAQLMPGEAQVAPAGEIASGVKAMTLRTAEDNSRIARQILLGLVVIVFTVGMLVAANTSASAVTRERESQTLDLLLCTPITSRYYIWGKLRGLVSFMLPFAIVPSVMLAIILAYDLYRQSQGSIDPLLAWPEVLLELPLYMTAVLAWTCMLGLNLSLKFSRTIVAVIATVSVLMGVCGLLGICGLAVFRQNDLASILGLLVAPFSPFTAIAVMLRPGETIGGSTPQGVELGGRIVFFCTLLIACGVFCILTWTMYRSMVKNFDMIIRRQHQ